MGYVKQVIEKLGSKAVPIVLNIGDEEDFKGIVDLVKNQAIVWHDDNFGSTFDVVDIPDDLKEESQRLRGELIEAVAEYDENLMEKYFEDPASITEQEIHQRSKRLLVLDNKYCTNDVRISF